MCALAREGTSSPPKPPPLKAPTDRPSVGVVTQSGRVVRKASRHTKNTVHSLQSWENAMVYAPTTLLPYYMSFEHSWAPTFFGVEGSKAAA